MSGRGGNDGNTSIVAVNTTSLTPSAIVLFPTTPKLVEDITSRGKVCLLLNGFRYLGPVQIKKDSNVNAISVTDAANTLLRKKWTVCKSVYPAVQ